MKMRRPARIFVPSVASPAKMEQIRGYGARLEIAGELYNDALLASREWVARSGATAIHAYDQAETLQGQATVGLEYEEQAPRLDALLVAVGGGGLIGGIAAWYGGGVGGGRGGAGEGPPPPPPPGGGGAAPAPPRGGGAAARRPPRRRGRAVSPPRAARGP